MVLLEIIVSRDHQRIPPGTLGLCPEDELRVVPSRTKRATRKRNFGLLICPLHRQRNYESEPRTLVACDAGPNNYNVVAVEVQYLRTTITDEQRQEFGHLVENTISRIESADFLPHSGIRFPQNPCSSCPYVGLCLGKQETVDATLVRRPGAESLDWLDELNY